MIFVTTHVFSYSVCLIWKPNLFLWKPEYLLSRTACLWNRISISVLRESNYSQAFFVNHMFSSIEYERHTLIYNLMWSTSYLLKTESVFVKTWISFPGQHVFGTEYPFLNWENPNFFKSFFRESHVFSSIEYTHSIHLLTYEHHSIHWFKI